MRGSVFRSPCPHCAMPNDAHIGRSDLHPVPDPGDGSICVHCGGLAVYFASPLGIRLRKPTPEEAAEYEAMPEFQAARAALAEQSDLYEAMRQWRADKPERGEG